MAIDRREVLNLLIPDQRETPEQAGVTTKRK